MRGVEAAGPGGEVYAARGGTAAGGADVVDGYAGVDGVEHLDGGEDLGVAEGELRALELGRVHAAAEIGGVDGQPAAAGVVGAELDEGPGGGAVAVLEGSDDVAPARELAEVVCVVGPGRGHAVGENDERELLLLLLLLLLLRGEGVGGQERRVHLRRDGDAPGQGPEEEGEDGAGDEVVDVGDLGVALGRETDGPGDPGVPRLVAAEPLFGGVVQGQQYRLDLEGRVAGAPEDGVGDALGWCVAAAERHLDVEGADAVGPGVRGQVGGEEGLGGDEAVEDVEGRRGGEDVAPRRAGAEEGRQPPEEGEDAGVCEADCRRGEAGVSLWSS